ncbi:MAG: ribosome maturation factor RimM [Cyanobium sp.]|nr:ribosome maturation factor RimM [Cyanobium sp.]
MQPQPAPQAGHQADPQPETSSHELMVVGRLVAPQGLRGELRVLPLSDFPERFTHAGRRWLRRAGQEARQTQLLGGRSLPGKELFVVRLEGVDSRETAEALVGEELLVRSDDRPRLGRGEFHVLDLVGLEVRLLADRQARIGRVIDLHHAGNDLLEVQLDSEEGTRGRRVLVPFVAAIVPQVELAEGWLGLTPPPGLLDL